MMLVRNAALNVSGQRSEWGQCFALGYPRCDLRAKRAPGRLTGFQGRSGANSTWRSGPNPRQSPVAPDLGGERPPERR